ncbi:MAG: diguanylate cyclase, partial [Acidobacteria bacterium]|nr:diguanylate cyclase [Acidobacteriota bacterium]
AERLRARLEQMDIPEVGHITASFGVATFPLHANSRDSLVSSADRALYDAKNSGRNQVRSPHVEPIILTDEMFELDEVADNPSPVIACEIADETADEEAEQFPSLII